MIAVNRLLNLRHSPTGVRTTISPLYGLEVDNGSFVQVIELRMVPVGLSAAKFLILVSISDPWTTDYGDIILDIF